MIGLTSAFGAAGVPFAATPFIASWNPSASAKAVGAPVKVDITKLAPGQQIQVGWRKQPIFVIRHSAEAMKNLDSSLSKLADPNSDAIDEPYKNQNPTRSKSSEYSVLVGVCTHLGCVPLGQKSGDVKGQYGGWFCPCHGSHYDHSGRIRKGPAPTNLAVPSYKFLSDTLIKIG